MGGILALIMGRFARLPVAFFLNKEPASEGNLIDRHEYIRGPSILSPTSVRSLSLNHPCILAQTHLPPTGRHIQYGNEREDFVSGDPSGQSTLP